MSSSLTRNIMNTNLPENNHSQGLVDQMEQATKDANSMLNLNSCMNDPLVLDKNAPGFQTKNSGELLFVDTALCVADAKKSDVEKAIRRKQIEEARKLGLEVDSDSDSDASSDFDEFDPEAETGMSKSTRNFCCCMIVVVILVTLAVGALALTKKACFEEQVTPYMKEHGYHYDEAGNVVDADGMPVVAGEAGPSPAIKVIVGVAVFCGVYWLFACCPCFECMRNNGYWCLLPASCKEGHENPTDTGCMGCGGDEEKEGENGEENQGEETQKEKAD